MRPNYWSDFLICFVADSKLRYTFLVDSRNLMGQIDTLANLQSQILILLVFDDPMEKVNAYTDASISLPQACFMK